MRRLTFSLAGESFTADVDATGWISVDALPAVRMREGAACSACSCGVAGRVDGG
jgi:hypothetical protein